jgi:hypothetical protein
MTMTTKGLRAAAGAVAEVETGELIGKTILADLAPSLDLRARYG